MKAFITGIFLALTFFLLCSESIQAENEQSPFRLFVQQTFSPDEEAIVHFSRYCHRYNCDDKIRKYGPLELKLLKVKDIKSIIAHLGKENHLWAIQEAANEYEIIKSWEVEPEKQHHYRQTKDIALGKLDAGFYILIGIQDGLFASVPVAITKYGMTTRTVGKSTLAYVYDKQSGRAVTDFNIEMLAKSNVVRTISIENGVARIDIENKDSGDLLLMASFDDGFALSKSYFNLYRYQSKTTTKSYVFTDRSAYRPGQMLYYKGTIRNKEDMGYSIFPNEEIICTIYDSDNKELLKRTLLVDEHGSFTDSIQIGEDWKLGEYSITWKKSSDAEPTSIWYYHYDSDRDICKFRIEEYKKPEYAVNVSFEESQYLMNDSIVATVDAQYFFGAPVIEAEVRYTIMRKEHHIPWYRKMRCWWWYQDYYGGHGNREIVDYGDLELDENGKAEIRFASDGDSGRNYKYYLQAEVIDASRRSIVGMGEVVVAKAAFSLNVRSQKRYYTLGNNLEFSINAADFSDQAVETEFTAELTKGYLLNNAVLKKETGKTNAKTGEASLTFTSPQKAGRYHLKVSATDKDGRTTSAESYVYVYRKGQVSENYWDDSKEKIEVLTDKKVYNAGEKVTTMLLMQDVSDAFFVVHSDRIQYYEVCELEGEDGVSHEMEFVIDPKSFGKMTIYTSYVFENEMHVGQSEITIIPYDRYLDVTVEFAKGEYQPGQVSEATVRVLDYAGKPVSNAEVSLSTSDESLYFLYPDKTKSIERVFYKSTNNRANSSFSNWQYRNSSNKLRAKELLWMYVTLDVQVNKNFFLAGSDYMRYRQHLTGKKLKLSGFVVDFETGQPIEGAEIHIGGKAFKTNKWGYYDLTGLTKGKTKLSFKTEDGETHLPDFGMGEGLDAELNVAIQKGKSKTIKKKELAKQNIIISEDETIMTSVNVGETFTYTISLSNQGASDASGIAVTDKVLHNLAGLAWNSNFSGSFKQKVPGNSGADGADGRDGDTGPQGNTGPRYDSLIVKGNQGETGDNGINCWDLNGNGLGDAEEDQNGDGRFDANDCNGQTGPDEEDKLLEAKLRRDFRDAIYWNPRTRTDENGEVKIKIQLPDNLTTWRTTARVITDDTRIGQTMAKLVTTKNLLVRMELPRFMAVGDKLLIATNVHNYLGSEKEVTLRLKAKGVSLKGSEKKVVIPANGEKRVDWEADAKWIMDATVSVEALTNEESDAMQLTIPVQPFGLEMVRGESLAVLDQDEGSMEFELPCDIDPASASLKLNVDKSVSSALLASLEDLIGYPYGCVEQTMSRFLPTVIVSNTLDKMGTDYSSTIDTVEIQKMVDQGFKRLGELQNKNGGWGWWSSGNSHPFMTAYVLYGMQIAKESGLEVDKEAFEKAKKAFRQQVESNLYHDQTTFAYQMMVAMHLGYYDLWKKAKMPNGNEGPYAQALWLQAANIKGDFEMQKQMLARLSDNAIHEAGVVYWGDKRFYKRWQDDRVETTANVIKAISETDPNNPLLLDAVQWIMRQRNGNSWHNTRQTAMTVYGLQEIIKRESNNDSSVEIWVNGSQIESFDWTKEKDLTNGKSWKIKPEEFTASRGNEIDLSKYNLLREGTNKVEIKQTGKGITYLSGRLRYFRDGIPENETEYGEPTFEVEREYYKLTLQESGNGKNKYVKEKLKKNEWKSGDAIMVKVKLSAKDELEYMLVEDPIPAGCEFIRHTEAYIIEGEDSYRGRRSNSWNYWYTHSEFRDDKFAMTVTRMRKGEFEYSYLLKAQIPGEYKVSPAVAQLMYYPEFRGYSDFAKVTISD